MNVFIRSGLLLGLMMAVAPPGVAHHSFAMFDYGKEVTLKGTVQEYQWENPHVHVSVAVTKVDGADATKTGMWDIEGASINIMARQGWTRASYKAGDQITAVGHPLKSGKKGLSLFYVVKPDGTRMYQDVSRPASS